MMVCRYLEGRLDLNRHVVRRPTSTFFIKVEGDSMEGEGIFDGDLLNGFQAKTGCLRRAVYRPLS